jgi:hypothetical protein
VNNIFGKIGYYLALPVILTSGLILIFNRYSHDLGKAVSVSATIIQALAIFIGGLWAYHKFDWEKKAESAIKIKAALMEYEQYHCEAAGAFRVQNIKKRRLVESLDGFCHANDTCS